MREDVSSKKLLASLLALAILAAVIPCAAALDSAALPAIIVRLDELKDVMEEKRRIIAFTLLRQAADNTHQRGFSGSVLSHQSIDRLFRHMNAHMVQNRFCSVDFRQMICLQNIFHIFAAFFQNLSQLNASFSGLDVEMVTWKSEEYL